MILKGNERAGGKQLALHLLKTDDNEHVHIHELRGFVSDDLQSAFHEAYAVSRGTRAEKYLFSLSLNPPSKENVETEAFEAAIDQIERKLGLEGQPRAIVFHEKDGRRHAHAVWSRIDAENMKAINLPHYKLKLRDVSKQLYLEHGWQMPRGLMDSKARDPVNFSHSEWEHAKRSGHDPKAVKRLFQECWAASDSDKAFTQALASRGFYLAQGDRRGFVAVDFRGEVFSVAKYVGLKTKDVRSRLGKTELPSVDQVRKTIAARMTQMLKRHVEEAEAQRKAQSASLAFKRKQVIEQQREERAALDLMQKRREAREVLTRSQRLTTGMRGLWDRVTGKRARVQYQNEREAYLSFKRDRAEKDALIFKHIEQRQVLHNQALQARQMQAKRLEQLQRDTAAYMEMVADGPPNLRAHFREAHGRRERLRPHDRGRDAEPDLER